MALPFLPGRYDSLAMPLALMTQLFGHFSAASAHPYFPGAAFVAAAVLVSVSFLIYWTATRERSDSAVEALPVAG